MDWIALFAAILYATGIVGVVTGVAIIRFADTRHLNRGFYLGAGSIIIWAIAEMLKILIN